MRHRATHKRRTQWLLAGIGAVTVVTGGLYILHLYYFSSPAATLSIKQPMATAPTDNSPEKTATQKARYAVPPTQPRQIRIPTIGVDANIVAVGTLNDGTLAAPASAWDAGWFNASSLPGTGNGALLLDGHVNNKLGTPGLFYDLHRLKVGDSIQIERGDHTLVNYKVIVVTQTPIEQVDMSRLMRSVTPSKEGLNLITCGGQYDSKRQTFTDRVLVYSERI